MSRTAYPLPVRDVSAFAKALSRQLAALERQPGHLELLNMLARSAGFQNFQHLRAAQANAPGLDAALAGSPACVATDQARALAPDSAPPQEAPRRDTLPSRDILTRIAHGQARPGDDRPDRGAGPVLPAAPGQGVAPAEASAEVAANAPGDPAGDAAADPVRARRLRRLLRFFDASGRLVRWPGKYGEQGDCLWVLWSRLAPGPAGDEAAINARLAALHTFGDHALLRRELFDRGLVDRTPDGRAYRRVERAPDAQALALIREIGAHRAG